MNTIKNNLSIEKCLKPIDLIDFYITKNILKLIKNKKSFDFIKKNIFLLGITNKNNKNSLMILLENGEFEIINKLVQYNFEILSYKNIHENNLLKLLLAYSYFYEHMINYIKQVYEQSEIDFLVKILTENNIQNINFIDNLIALINMGEENFNGKIIDSLLTKLLIIGKQIYLIDFEKITLFITKLCKVIQSEEYLLYILNFFNIDNFDIYPDTNMLNCVDYLILNEYFIILEYFLDKINHIEFINIDNNLIFSFLESSNVDIKTKSNIVLKILSKSNISKFKNNKNQNIFYYLIKDFGIGLDILMKFITMINIYEQDIYGKSLYDIVNELFGKNDLEKIKLLTNKKLLKSYSNEFEKINIKINIKNKLVKSSIGIFTSNIIHNMLYTIVILKPNSKYISIPNFKQSDKYKLEQEKLINMSNNEKNILSYLKLYFTSFNTWLPHLILWKNKNNYWIDPNLINIIKQKQKSFAFHYIKLSVYLLDNTNTRHSNCIIIDNVNKIVERFEPYGEMVFTNSSDINTMITNQIAKPLGYEFVFVQPYPGFQSRSDEYAKYNKTYGDPMGFCLGWSFLYIYIKLELFKYKSKINPIDFINWYIINKFQKDFNIDKNENKTNKYILFIRYFALYLDKEKNKLIKSYNLNPELSYQSDLDLDYHNKIVANINLDLEHLFNK